MKYQDILDVDKKRTATLTKYYTAVLKDEMSCSDLAETIEKNDFKILPYEFAYVEQSIFDEGIPEEKLIDKSLEFFTVLEQSLYLDKKRPKLSTDHPLIMYTKENDALRVRLNDGTKLLEQPFNAEKWRAYAQALQEYKIHYVRKQNQLYPHLEDKGYTYPSRIMWTYDDEVRDALSEFLKTTKDGLEKAVVSAFEVLRDHALLVMRKEEGIIFPTAFKLLTLNEFLKMEMADDDIGYAFIESPNYNKAEAAMMQGLETLMIHHDGSKKTNETFLNVNHGKVTLNQLKLIFEHLPYDISFVDAEELVRFYNETPHRIFPRSPGVIGRNVKNCHPRESLRTVEKIINNFRSGEKDVADFWLEYKGRFVYIKYIAVRDTLNRFHGVLELAQDITDLQKLSGEKRLLDWDLPQDD